MRGSFKILGSYLQASVNRLPRQKVQRLHGPRWRLLGVTPSKYVGVNWRGLRTVGLNCYLMSQARQASWTAKR